MQAGDPFGEWYSVDVMQWPIKGGVPLIGESRYPITNSAL